MVCLSLTLVTFIIAHLPPLHFQTQKHRCCLGADLTLVYSSIHMRWFISVKAYICEFSRLRFEVVLKKQHSNLVRVLKQLVIVSHFGARVAPEKRGIQRHSLLPQTLVLLTFSQQFQ